MIVVAFTTTTFVAATPPNDTVAPLWKPVPAIVTLSPPFAIPTAGLTDVTVTDGGVAVTFTFPDLVSLQPEAVVTVT